MAVQAALGALVAAFRPVAGEVGKCECPSDSQLREGCSAKFWKAFVLGDFSIRHSNIWAGLGLVAEKRPRGSSGRKMEP